MSGERVLINAKTEGNGQIASSDDGSGPVFDEEYAYQQAVYNALKGTVVKLIAKADEGWTFKEWKNVTTGTTYSTNEAITIEANEALELVAVFEGKQPNITSDEEFLQWVNNDYEKKTGTTVAPEYVIQNDDKYTISLKDKDGKKVDTYVIDPKTGIGSDDSSDVDLPQTGMSGAHKAIAGLAALMGITGIGLVKKSRKDDDE